VVDAEPIHRLGDDRSRTSAAGRAIPLRGPVRGGMLALRPDFVGG